MRTQRTRWLTFINDGARLWAEDCGYGHPVSCTGLWTMVAGRNSTKRHWPMGVYWDWSRDEDVATGELAIQGDTAGYKDEAAAAEKRDSEDNRGKNIRICI